MNRSYRFEWGKNSAKNFFIIEADLKRIAADRNVAPQEVIREFIIDLENRENPDYEAKVKELEMNGILSQKFIIDAKNHFNKVIKGLERTQKDVEHRAKNNACKKGLESVWENVKEFIEGNKDLTLDEILSQIKEKSTFQELSDGQRKTIIKRTEKLIGDEKKKEAVRKAKIEKTWKEVCEIVERESFGKDFTKPQYWIAIRDRILGPEEGESIGIKLNKSIQPDILQLIDAKIRDEKDLLYYNQVKYFTEDFRFFRDYPEVVRAGSSVKRRKFTDLESYGRFFELRALVQQGIDEYSQISMVLDEGNIDEISKRILKERMDVLKEKRKQEESFENHGGR